LLVTKSWPDKTIIGLTGNIATGKSAVMRMAAEQGALALDADKIVHELLAADPDIQSAIVSRFGEGACNADGRINRAALAGIVFRDAAALRKLEQITHPAVRRVIKERIDDSEAAVVFIEAIKLLEGDLAAECDQIWVTRAPQRQQIERLIVCRGMDWETAAMRVNAQPPQEEKVSQANVVIDTDASMADTRSQFEMAWERLGVPSQAPPARQAAARPAAKAAPKTAAKAETAAKAKPATRPKAAPERLSSDKAGELRRRLQQKRPTAAQQPVAKEAVVTTRGPADPVTVRRARPSDIPSILLLIQRATAGTVKMKRSDLLLALGERSYFISQEGSEITAVLGWNSENLVARIDQIFVHPPEAAAITAVAALTEIEQSADKLICEVVMAFLPHETADAVRQVFAGRGYTVADPGRLPRAWQSAAEESQPDNTFIMLKVLRDTRITEPI
jgi:dephospho-CoA kinase